VPPANKAFLCLLKEKTELKGQDQSERGRKRENLHGAAKLRIFFQMDVKAGGNPTRKTHILKVPFLIIHRIDPRCSWECRILGGKFYMFHIR
jgi:hypothetical protein